jgi:hypothetical protein
MAYYLHDAKGRSHIGPNNMGAYMLGRFAKKHCKEFPLVYAFMHYGEIGWLMKEFATECRAASKLANAHVKMDLLNIAKVAKQSGGHVGLNQDM